MLFFTGFYLIVALTMQFRNILAMTQSPEINIGAAMVFMALWVYLGCMLVPFQWLKERDSSVKTVSTLCLLLPLAALAASFIDHFTMLMWPPDSIAACFIAGMVITLPLGVWCGAMGTALRSGESTMGRYLNCSGLAAGMISGGVVLSLAVERVAWGDRLLITAGGGIILWTGIGIFRLLKSKKDIFHILIWGGLSVVCCLMLYLSNQWFMQTGMAHYLPGWKLIRSVELPGGKMSFFEDLDNRSRPENLKKYRIYLNRSLLWELPADRNLYSGGLLPLLIQKNQPNMRIMVVAPQFYSGIELLARMPQSGIIEVVCPYRNLFEFSRENNLLSGFYKALYIGLDPKSYLKSVPYEYDLIILTDPCLLVKGTLDEFIVAGREKLAKGGVIAVQAAENPLGKYFSYIAKVPGCSDMMMGSNSPLCTDIRRLGERFDSFMTLLGAEGMVPGGIFEILYQVPQSREFSAREREQEYEKWTLPSFATSLAVWQIILLAVLAGVYFSIRFLAVRHGNSSLAFTATENGICGAGFFYIALLLQYSHGVMIYQQFGLLLGLAGMVLISELVPGPPKLRIFTTALSCILPLIIVYNGEYYDWLLAGALIMMYVSVGQVSQELERRRTILTEMELNKWYLGGVFYGFAGIMVILLCTANLFFGGLLLILLRLAALVMMFAARK